MITKYTYDNIAGFPSPLEVNRFMSEKPNQAKPYGEALFPSPREDIVLYPNKIHRLLTGHYGFRPLSRYIGLYPNIKFTDANWQKFPSSLEVNRFIS